MKGICTPRPTFQSLPGFVGWSLMLRDDWCKSVNEGHRFSPTRSVGKKHCTTVLTANTAREHECPKPCIPAFTGRPLHGISVCVTAPGASTGGACPRAPGETAVFRMNAGGVATSQSGDPVPECQLRRKIEILGADSWFLVYFQLSSFGIVLLLGRPRPDVQCVANIRRPAKFSKR